MVNVVERVKTLRMVQKLNKDNIRNNDRRLITDNDIDGLLAALEERDKVIAELTAKSILEKKLTEIEQANREQAEARVRRLEKVIASGIIENHESCQDALHDNYTRLESRLSIAREGLERIEHETSNSLHYVGINGIAQQTLERMGKQ